MSIAIQSTATHKVSFFGGRVPLDLRFRGPLEAKPFVRVPELDPPGAPLKCRSCGHGRRCTQTTGQFVAEARDDELISRLPEPVFLGAY